jgi:DNA invertase Pin-like site-specific DNA recombinase
MSTPKRERLTHPSDVIQHYVDVFHLNLPVFTYARISDGRSAQYYRGNLDDQHRTLVDVAGDKLVGSVKCVEKGTGGEHRKGLLKVVSKANKYGELHETKVIVLSESTSRLIRGRKYTKFNQDELPTPRDLEWLDQIKGEKVILATVCPPDITPKRERGEQTKRGNNAKKSNGYKKKRKENNLRRVREFKEQGMSYRDISRLVGIPVMTLYDWINHR